MIKSFLNNHRYTGKRTLLRFHPVRLQHILLDEGHLFPHSNTQRKPRCHSHKRTHRSCLPRAHQLIQFLSPLIKRLIHVIVLLTYHNWILWQRRSFHLVGNEQAFLSAWSAQYFQVLWQAVHHVQSVDDTFCPFYAYRLASHGQSRAHSYFDLYELWQ